MEKQETTKEEQMLQEIAKLKRRINGFRLTNDGLKKKVESLTQELEKAKVYGAEADELNERKADMVYSMKKEKEAQDAIIKELKETIATLPAPWYKRIFK